MPLSADLNSPFTLPHWGAFLPTRLLPGPMEGVTTGEFLQSLTRHGWIQAWWTPFLRISAAVPRDARLHHWFAPYKATGLPVIAQVMGTDASRLAQAAAGLWRQGARAIDLNCACPSPIVVGNGAGGARLAFPEWIQETILRIKDAVDCPVGVKLRMGKDAPQEFLTRIASALRQASPDFVTVHFRTVAEMYRPIPDGLERLRRAREALADIPLVGSGDLFTPGDVFQMRDFCGVDAVAPARGLLKNPRLLADIRLILEGHPVPEWSLPEKQALLQEFRERGTQKGFLLQMAANLFGRDSAEFQETIRSFRP